ncbi:MAG: LPS export ABC transporter periplasmic protein LptC [Thalassobaculaceae bacterium]|nr:LPS export ABC transporter periplasmic protein LptC [Thalassobaculaceae bacterium]
MLLPALAITLVAMVLIWPQFGRNAADIPVDQAPVTLEDVDTLRMANPRFVGLDENDRPFEIVARTAIQVGENGQAVELDHPQADMINEDGTWVSLNAEEGIWFKDASVVNLTGGVSLFHDAGHQLLTEEAMIDMGPGNVFSEVPTQGQSPGGTIQGEGMQSLDRGARIIFTGRSRAVLYSTGSSE